MCAAQKYPSSGPFFSSRELNLQAAIPHNEHPSAPKPALKSLWWAAGQLQSVDNNGPSLVCPSFRPGRCRLEGSAHTTAPKERTRHKKFPKVSTTFHKYFSLWVKQSGRELSESPTRHRNQLFQLANLCCSWPNPGVDICRHRWNYFGWCWLRSLSVDWSKSC